MTAEGTLLTKILELQNSLTKESNLKEFVEIAEFQLTLINQFKKRRVNKIHPLVIETKIR